MKIQTIFTLLFFAITTTEVSAQSITKDLIIIGAEGSITVIESGAESSIAPIVLIKGDVLGPGDIDCEVAASHPQCRSLSLLLGDGNDDNYEAPGVVIVAPGQGAIVLSGVYPGDYPPPLVVLDDCIVNRQGLQSSCH
jgi:hypothetical protein